MTTLPPSLADLHDVVEHALAPELALLAERLVAIDPELAPIGGALQRFASSGKRLRPMLLLLGHALVGGRDHRDVLGPALALELVHTAALVHDDVIDRTELRRGEPTMHEGFARQHRADGGRIGDPEAFGRAVAILAGDLALVAADERFRSAQVAAPALERAWERFTDLRIEVMAGQVLDVGAAAVRGIETTRALTIATLKSGRYTVARPLEIGALLAGASPELADELRRAGDPLGRAFQLRDDLLGVFGDPDRTGKPRTSDLAEGKRTLLIAEALARLDDAGRAELEAGLGAPDLDEGAAARLRALIEDCGARGAVEDRIEADLSAGLDALDALGRPGDRASSAAGREGVPMGAGLVEDVRSTLRTLAVHLARRQH